MTDKAKLIHVTIFDSDINQVNELKKYLTKLKETLPFEVEFLVTNDKVELRDIKVLINELYNLYKRDKKLKETKQSDSQDVGEPNAK